MRVAITGAFGYLGGRIADHLRQHGDEPILVARSVPEGARAWAKAFEVRFADALDESASRAAFEGVDAVVHLASLDEREAVKDPERAKQVSGEGTRRTLAAARGASVGRVVFFSTFHVYGVPYGAIDESMEPRPTHPYAIAHREGELHVARARSEGQSAVVLRLSNGYGAPSWVDVDRWTLAHNDFCRQAVESGVIRLASSGTQHRDFVALDDVAAATRLVLRAADTALGDGVLNVGGARSISIYELATRVRDKARQVLGRDIQIERPEPNDAEEAPKVAFSITKLARLGYAPTERIDEETERVLALLRR